MYLNQNVGEDFIVRYLGKHTAVRDSLFKTVCTISTALAAAFISKKYTEYPLVVEKMKREHEYKDHTSKLGYDEKAKNQEVYIKRLTQQIYETKGIVSQAINRINVTSDDMKSILWGNDQDKNKD